MRVMTFVIFLFVDRVFGGALGWSTKCRLGLLSVCLCVTRNFCLAANKRRRVQTTLKICWSVRRNSESWLALLYLNVTGTPQTCLSLRFAYLWFI